MNPILSVYLICTFICTILNHKFYRKTILKVGKKRTYGLIVYSLFVFLGPLSLVLTVLSLIQTTYRKIKSYIKIRQFKNDLRKELKKRMPEMVEELEKACKEYGVTVVD